MNALFTKLSLQDLVERFTNTTTGHPDRKNVILELARRSIAISFGSCNDPIKHRSAADGKLPYYTITRKSIFLQGTHREQKGKMLISTIESLSICDSTSTPHIRID